MACFYSEIEVEVSVVFNNYLSVFDLIDKNVAKTNLALLIALNRVGPAT